MATPANRNAKFGQIQVHERITGTSRELLLQIKELAENMGFEILHGIVDYLRVVGEPISVFKEAVEKETGILTEVDSYDWITFLPMSDGGGAYNCYFGRLNTGKMKIRGVKARKDDTPEYVNKMQQEVFQVLAEARSLEDLRKIEPKAQHVYRRFLDGLDGADVRELAIHRRVSRLNYSRRCAEERAWRLVAILEMTSLSQSPRDRILWILANSGGRMERSRLRAHTGMRYAFLNPILEELAREGRIIVQNQTFITYQDVV